MTIKEVAEICGVSISTVSKILHNKDSNISSETRKRVLDVIKKYNYVPYSKAYQNNDRKTYILGVLIHYFVEQREELLYCLEKEARKNGYSLVVSYTSGIACEDKEILRLMQNKGIDGIICICQDKKMIEAITLPRFIVDDYKSEMADIYFERKELAFSATEYLITMGHRKIACAINEKDEEVQAGYAKALKSSGILSDTKDIYIMDNEPANYKKYLLKCINTNVTALICSNVKIAQQLYELLQERKISVPNELSVITLYDDTFCSLLTPKITTVKIPIEELTSEAVEVFVERLEGNKEAIAENQKLSVYIQERGSVSKPPIYKQGGKLVVVGSMNMDWMIKASHIPTEGETIICKSISELPGGKGANQAVGASKLGGLVYTIGCVGNDACGREIYNGLINHSVRVEGVIFDDSMPTGKAYINVSDEGKSTIVVYPGANQKLDESEIAQKRYLFENAQYCLLASEIPEETIEYILRLCKKENVRVIFKPSAIDRMKEELYQMIDYFIPNEKELNHLIACRHSVEEKAQFIIDKGVKNVIVTMGSKGCYLKNQDIAKYIDSIPFNIVDTTGAADAFISAMAVCLSEGKDLLYAIVFATYAAGLSITREGVQTAMVDRQAIEIFKDKIYHTYQQYLDESTIR